MTYYTVLIDILPSESYFHVEIVPEESLVTKLRFCHSNESTTGWLSIVFDVTSVSLIGSFWISKMHSSPEDVTMGKAKIINRGTSSFFFVFWFHEIFVNKIGEKDTFNLI